MEAVEFKGVNKIIGENQEEYRPLPALLLDDGQVITCWELSDDEMERIMKTRKFYISQLTFNKGLQPILPMVDLSDAYNLE